MAGKLDTVHFRHDDIGQQQVEPIRFDMRHGLGAGGDRHHLITRLFQRPRQIGAHAVIIFRQQDSNH